MIGALNSSKIILNILTVCGPKFGSEATAIMAESLADGSPPYRLVKISVVEGLARVLIEITLALGLKKSRDVGLEGL
jgi:hypothetical protein